MKFDTLVCASGNPGKIRELRQLCADLPFAIVGLDAFPELVVAPETGTTFIENALIKARSVADQSGLPALADDSGLCVAALDGRPGVYSARYAGAQATDQDRNIKLLAELQGVADRAAYFACAIALAFPDQRNAITAEGRCHGSILEAARGDGGFGYDPVFLSTDLGRTFAEASPAEKQQVSHRARAMQGLLPQLQSLW